MSRDGAETGESRDRTDRDERPPQRERDTDLVGRSLLSAAQAAGPTTHGKAIAAAAQGSDDPVVAAEAAAEMGRPNRRRRRSG